ncbi:hypothetical protein PBY51_003378 [Eleginops maclovinus]|uniref:Ig-like domain-containing protein n=1 Tax=Eleginops maclovinus TaxID=56733 RepID=A0AAN8AE26_ELEMC|nr:hypothetical protein PBY51_003378 [Eleginops maclovinus]
MDSAAILLLLTVTASALLQVLGTEGVAALYGETIVVPCNDGTPAPEKLIFVKWKYEKDDGTAGDLLIKQASSSEATLQATDQYAERVSIDDKWSLRITQASLRDQKTFTCMVVSGENVKEYPVTVSVNKKPSPVQIMDRSAALQKDKATTVGTCVAADANPAATITWRKNGKPLVADGKTILVTPSMKLDPATGLSTTSSTLQYAASKEDNVSVFSCMSTHMLANQEAELEPFPIHYPSEKVSLQVLSFFFYMKGQKVLVENSDTYTLASIGREAGGEYKCSLADNEKMESSQSLVVSYLDLSVTPTGRVVKAIGDSFSVKVEKSASGDATVSWAKNGMEVTQPEFSRLTYADAGVYVCELSMPGLTRHSSFELMVEGKPAITGLSKHRPDSAKFKVLTCEATGVPEPSFHWSVNSTNEESSYVNGKATHKIRVIPRLNLTVTCSVSNRLGDDTRTINVSSVFKEEKDNMGSQEESEDQSKLIVGVVAGLLIATAVVGLIYWLYMKNSRQGSWKTGEKEVGTSEESKKLEENHHSV